MPAVPQPAVSMPAVSAARAATAAGLVLALALAAARPAAAAEDLAPADSARPPLLDLDGRPVDPLASPGVATVFLFVRGDCPISGRYAPELRRIAGEVEGRGVSFYLVHADPDESADEIRRWRADFALPFPALRDPGQRLVARTGATVTPEAAVFDGDGRMVYRGRIDDRWAGLGRARPAPTHRDLAEVLAALLAGERPEPRTTRAVGCFIPPVEPAR